MRIPAAPLLVALLLALPAAPASAAPAKATQKAASKAAAKAPAAKVESPVAAQDDERVIRARRKDNNATISARHAEAMAAFLTEDMALMDSDGEVLQGRAKVVADYERVEFKDPSFVGYDRQTDAVIVDPSGTVAAERGHWQGQFRMADGTIVGNSGVYLAGWVKQNGVWLIRTEAYVRTLCGRKAGCH